MDACRVATEFQGAFEFFTLDEKTSDPDPAEGFFLFKRFLREED